MMVARSSPPPQFCKLEAIEGVAPASDKPAVPAMALMTDLRCRSSLLPMRMPCLLLSCSNPIGLPLPWRQRLRQFARAQSGHPGNGCHTMPSSMTDSPDAHQASAAFSKGGGGLQRQNKASKGTTPASSANSRGATSPIPHHIPTQAAQAASMSPHCPTDMGRAAH